MPYSIKLKEGSPNGRIVGTRGPYKTKTSAVSAAREIARQNPSHAVTVEPIKRKRRVKKRNPAIQYKGHTITTERGGVYRVHPYMHDFYTLPEAEQWLDGHVRASMRRNPRVTSRSPNKPGYAYYVVVGGQIESGWEFKEDADDRRREIIAYEGYPASSVKVRTRRSLGYGPNGPSNAARWGYTPRR